jgi:hypothetical protein
MRLNQKLRFETALCHYVIVHYHYLAIHWYSNGQDRKKEDNNNQGYSLQYNAYPTYPFGLHVL